MAGQARKFTDDQRQAVVRAVTVLAMTQVDTIRLAKAGELETEKGEKLAPFSIARGTLQGYLRRAVGDPSEDITSDRLRRQLLSALRAEVECELPKLNGRKKLDYITQALHAVKAAERPSTKTERAAKKEGPPVDPEAEELRSESLERLAVAAGNGDGPAPTDVPTQGGHGATQPPVAQAQGEAGHETEQGADGGVLHPASAA